MSCKSCLFLVYVLSISCQHLLYVFSMSCLCLVHLLLCVVYVLSMCSLCLIYVLSMACLCFVYVLSMSCLCLVYFLSMPCLFLVHFLSMSCNFPNRVMYEIWRKTLTVSDRRTDGQTKWAIEELASLLIKHQSLRKNLTPPKTGLDSWKPGLQGN